MHTGLLAFINHSCSSKYNVGPLEGSNNADEDWGAVDHNPFIDRNARTLIHSMNLVANSDIPAGSDVLGLTEECTADLGDAPSYEAES